jgi:hypothetical protein
MDHGTFRDSCCTRNLRSESKTTEERRGNSGSETHLRALSEIRQGSQPCPRSGREMGQLFLVGNVGNRSLRLAMCAERLRSRRVRRHRSSSSSNNPSSAGAIEKPESPHEHCSVVPRGTLRAGVSPFIRHAWVCGGRGGGGVNHEGDASAPHDLQSTISVTIQVHPIRQTRICRRDSNKLVRPSPLRSGSRICTNSE